MKSRPKTNTLFLIISVFIFALSPIIASNLYFYIGNDDKNSANTNSYGIEDLTTSGIPALLVWSDNTSSNVRNVAISSNGQYIAVASYDFNLYLFEKDSSTPLWSSNLGQQVQSVAITPDGQYIVAGTTRPTNKVYFFEKNNSSPLWSYDTGGIVMSLAISSDGQYFAAGIGRDDYSVYLFEKNSSIPLWRYDAGFATGHVNSVGISSDGNYIVAGAYNGNLYFFGRNSSTPIWTYQTPSWAYHVAISSDGNYIIVGTTEGGNTGIYFFERNNSTPLWSYTTASVWSVAISSNGQYIVVGTANNKVYLFEKNSSTPLWSFQAGNNIRDIAISSDGQYIVAGSYDENVYFFDKNSSIPIWSYNTGASVSSVAISSNGTYFVAGAPAGTPPNVYLFQLAVIPQIAINFPIINQPCGLKSPEFSTTIYNLSPINTTWYTIDGGLTNYTFSGLTGFINQTAWDKEVDGVLTIGFYVNDSLGHIGFKDVQISKDSISPVITVLSPLENNTFGKTSPFFNISIIEDSLVSTWYTIENLTSNFSFSEFVGYIDQDAWTTVPEGQVNITFYAKDNAGNIGIERVFVIKIIPSQISGYNLIFLLGILSFVSIILVKKRRIS